MKYYYHLPDSEGKGTGKVVIADLAQFEKSVFFKDDALNRDKDFTKWIASLPLYGKCDPFLPVGWLPECEEEYEIIETIKRGWFGTDKVTFEQTHPDNRRIFLVPVTEQYYDQYQITHLFPDNWVITTKEIYDRTDPKERRIVRAKEDEKIPVEENQRHKNIHESAWPLNEVLKRLISASEYLLHKKDYDGSDYEEIEICVIRAKQIISAAPVETLPKGESIVKILHDGTKWYWCRCESCGWDNSSKYAGGGTAIADTGDYTDPCCPVCGSLKLDGDFKYFKEEDEGYKNTVVEIPLADFLAPYEKMIEKANRLEADKYWSQVESDGGIDMPKGEDEQDKLWDEVEDIFDKHTAPTGGGYEADCTDRSAFLSELKSKYRIHKL